MNYAENAALAAKLLMPKGLRREHFNEFGFGSYSRKLMQRVWMRTPAGYELWVQLESNVAVARYNMDVPAVPVPTLDGDAVEVSPAAISVAASTGAVTVHTFAELVPGADNAIPPAIRSKGSVDWDTWVARRGWTHILWTGKALTDKPIRQENLKQLLRHVCVPGSGPSLAIREALMTEVRQVRAMTVHALRARFPTADQCELMAGLAALILDEQVFSDIDECPFESTTRLSAHPHGLADK